MTEYEKLSLANQTAQLEVMERMAKFLGAIDSQVTWNARMYARDHGIKLTWHDPSVEPWPASTAKHGEEAVLPSEVKLGLPYHLRAAKTESQA